jgi:hypothetical protein
MYNNGGHERPKTPITTEAKSEALPSLHSNSNKSPINSKEHETSITTEAKSEALPLLISTSNESPRNSKEHETPIATEAKNGVFPSLINISNVTPRDGKDHTDSGDFQSTVIQACLETCSILRII